MFFDDEPMDGGTDGGGTDDTPKTGGDSDDQGGEDTDANM